MPKPLTLDGLLELTGRPAGTIHLMRHRFRGHREQLATFQRWTGIALTEEQAYNQDDPDPVSKSTAREVLNAVRFQPRFTELVSSEQEEGILAVGDTVLAFASTGGFSAEYLAAFDVVTSSPEYTWAEYQARYADLLRDPPASALEAFDGHQIRLVRRLGYNSCPSPKGALYHLRHNESVLTGLERRLIVGWRSPISWLQKKLDKEVLEIRPPGFVREFTGYLDFTLSFEELQRIVGTGSGEGDPVWRQRLSAVAGVYIIHAGDGQLYVGAAYGKADGGGFLGRWGGYARTHAVSTGIDDRVGLRENSGLRAFLDQGDEAQQRQRLGDLRFSIARTMDKHSPAKDVLDMERWFKEKLGSRARGLNDN
jgi:hypothetical protein